jgi:hypothetical protein
MHVHLKKKIITKYKHRAVGSSLLLYLFNPLATNFCLPSTGPPQTGPGGRHARFYIGVGSAALALHMLYAKLAPCQEKF